MTLMATEVRTPFSVSAVELSNGGLYRKQVLRFGTIDYTDRTGKQSKITFDRKYGEDLIQAFKDGAYPQVPFQLADADNRHTNAPDRTGGEVVGVELSSDGSGLDALLRTWGGGATVVEQNPRLGVSARIVENATLNGRLYPRALQHVLGTVDPQVRGMRPWEKVSAVEFSSGTSLESLDLSNASYERSPRMADKDEGKPGTTTLELSTAQVERLQAILEQDEGLEELARQMDELGLLGDLEANDEDDEDDEEPELTELSGPSAKAIELANAKVADLDSRVIELTNQLNAQRTDTEVAGFAREGLAPAVLEAARPLLTVSPGAVELSNGTPGQSVDPGEVVRELLTTVIELARSGHLLIDPDDERGSLQGDTKQTSEREALLKDWESYGG